MSEAAVTITDKATGSAPGAYNMSNGRWNYRPRFYAQDTWKIKPSLTLNYCLAYMFETGLYNTDLNKPAYLRPIIGKGNLAASEASYNQFSPAFGFAWSPLKSGKTVIQAMFQRIRERGEIGPLGDGRLTLAPRF